MSYTDGRGTLIYPEPIIQMMLEIKMNHKELWEIVKDKPDISEVLAEVGAYLNLEMDGMYEIETTCDDFCMMLKRKNSPIILPIDFH